MIECMVKKIVPFLPFGIAVLFLLLKLTSFSYRLSDTAGYFVLGEYVLKGKLLYKDIFFTNLPLFGYICALYVWVTRHSLLAFTEVSAIEAGFCAVIIVLLLRKERVSIALQCLIVTLFLFSSLVFASTEFNTGTFTATLFALGGYYWYREKRFYLSAVLFGLAFATKGYTVPIVIAVLIYDIVSRKLQSWSFVLPFGISVLVVFVPTLLYARTDFMQNVFGYTLTRPENIDRWEALQIFLFDNWLYFSLACLSLYRLQKQLLLNLIILITLLFLALYQDTYYFYYNIVLPFIVLTIPVTWKYITQRFPFEITRILFIAVCGVSLLLHMQSYLAMEESILVKEPEKLAEAVQKAHPDYVYGLFDVAPLVSYLSGVPLLNGLIDTNSKLFQRKVYDTHTITQDVFDTKTLVVLYGRSEGGRKLIMENDIVDFERVKKDCQLHYEHPIMAAHSINRIFLMKCYD